MPVNGDVERILQLIEKTLEDPIGYIRRQKSEKRVKVVGWLLTDVPEELIHAAGALPFGITGGNQSLSLADAHLQSWACSLARSCLGLGLEGKLSFLDGLIIPHTCDTTRNLGGIWKHAKPLPLMENYLIPRQVDRPSAKSYLIGELGRLKAKLEQCTRTGITVKKLHDSIALYNQNRALIQKLYRRHVEDPQTLNNRAIYNIIKSSMIMPKEDHNNLLRELDAALGIYKDEGNSQGYIKIALSGKVWEPAEVMNMLDDIKAVVVADDMATGHRYINGDVQLSGDPIEALAHRQITRMPFACYGTAQWDRRRFLTDMVRENGAAGLVFVHLKFCEPENYDYSDMKSACQSAGIPTLKIETEMGNMSLGQIETRLQAFLEVLRGGADND